MKIFVKTLKGTQFVVEVKPECTVIEVKKNIETMWGSDVYPAEQLMVIHQGKILKDITTLEENKVVENSFIVVILNNNKVASTGASTSAVAPKAQAPPDSAPLVVTRPSATSQSPAPASVVPLAQIFPMSTPAAVSPVSSDVDTYGKAASNYVTASNTEFTVQQILDMGGGRWDRITVIRALIFAFYNPERAVEYLYFGMPEQADAPPVSQPPTSAQAVSPAKAQQPAAAPTTGAPASGSPSTVPSAKPLALLSEVTSPAKAQQPATARTSGASASGSRSTGPSAKPLAFFLQGLPNLGTNASKGTLDFLCNSLQFQALRAMLQANPQILEPAFEALGWQNPHLLRIIQEHQVELLRLLREPVEGEGNALGGQLASAMPEAETLTPEEREAIDRLEAMGFDGAIVLEVFFACSKSEERAANYLLDHIHEFED